jgi:aminopeptidase N
MHVFTQYFGALPFGRIAITQQPQFSFGQSWPTLVYLPVSAFLDSTQRYSLLGAGAFNFAYFIDEVTAHEVAHQWWGHMVGWESYHDQWLSEGLAEFSAGLFLQASRPDLADYRKALERSRDQMLEVNEFGYSHNMAGPLWMGNRLGTPRNPRASQLNYSKGGYVIHMLRTIMHDRQLGDGPFIEMMKDFVKTHENRNATTESFKAVVEKHVALSPAMSSVSGGTMDWFFDQWVYGSEIPSYEFAYKLTPQDGGKTLVEARVTQSGVSDSFAMPVVLYAEADGRLLRLGSIDVRGSGPREVKSTLPIALTSIKLNANHDVLAREIKEVPY